MHSNYTLHCKINFDLEDAIAYLYSNGYIPREASQTQYLNYMSKTTICSHVRFIHGLTFFCEYKILKSICYCITDSKAAVDYLKDVKYDSKFDKGWWEQEAHVNPYKRSDSEDSWKSNIGFKNKNVNAQCLSDALSLISRPSTSLPWIYRVYQYLYYSIPDVASLNESYSHEAQILVLECIYHRSRIDNRIKYIESV